MYNCKCRETTLGSTPCLNKIKTGYKNIYHHERIPIPIKGL